MVSQNSLAIRSFLLVTSSVISGIISTPVIAQEDSKPDGMQDIIVTAERRESTIQKTPISIAAITGGDLNEKAIVNIDDALTQVVGTSIQGNANGAYIYIRGIGSSQDTNIGGPAVNLNFDGIYQQQTDAPLSAIYDVNRIEVLRGPQGTLYGRNATAGSINIITNNPRIGENSGSVRFLAGNYSALQAEAAANINLGGNAALRLAGLTNLHDGYLHPSGYNDANRKSIRAKLLVEPSPNVSILAAGEYIDIDENGTSGVLASDQANFGNYYAAQPTGEFLVNMKRAYIEAKIDMGFATLTVLPAYQRYEKLDDRLIVSVAPGVPVNIVNETQKTFETRLASNAGSPLTWVVGFYYLNSDQDNPVPTSTRTGLPFNFGSIQASTTESYAGFAQSTFAITEAFRLTGGVRYTRDEKSLTARSGTTGRANFNSFTYKAGAEFDLSPSSLMYANITTGFKAGGLDERFEAYAPEKLRSIAFGSKNRLFDNRLQVNIEVYDYKYNNFQATYGARCQNVACSPVLNFANAISNAGKAHIYGGELELEARPMRGTRLFSAVAYTHSRLSDLIIDTGTARDLTGTPTAGCSTTLTCPFVGTTVLSGQRLANAPEWTVQIGASQDIDIGDLGIVTLSADTKYSTDYVVSYSSGAAQDDYWRSNASIGWSNSVKSLSLLAFIKNIENNALLTTTVGPARLLAPPRTYGMQITAKF